MATIPPTDQWKGHTGSMHLSQSVKDMGDAADLITREGTDVWDWFRTWKPAEGQGYAWASHPYISLLVAHPLVERSGHSGASCAVCMRQLQFISANGFAAWQELEEN